MSSNTDNNPTTPDAKLPWESIEPGQPADSPSSAELQTIAAQERGSATDPSPSPAAPFVAVAPLLPTIATEDRTEPAGPALPIIAPLVSEASVPPDSTGTWSIPLLCAGIAMIACCLLIPQADQNRRLTYERDRLKLDLAHVDNRIAVNQEFLKKVADDPNLAERLAQRQMKVIRQGTAILDLKGAPRQEMSPFLLVAVPPPPPLPPYKPVGGRLATLCRSPRPRLYLLGAGLMLVAAGLVLGAAPRPIDD